MPNAITVYEHDRLRIGPDGLDDTQFERLIAWNTEHDCQYFRIENKAIRFLQYVGVIQVGNLTIEVLPKADRRLPSDDGAKDHWRDALIEMLRRSGFLNLKRLSNAHLRLKNATILDLYLECFLEEVKDLVHRGLTKKYRRREDNVAALKGRLVFSRHLAENLIHKERFYTEHTTYDRDHVFNQVLLCALRIILGTTTSPFLQMEAKTLLLEFDGITEKKTIPEQVFGRISYDRKTECYRTGIDLARLIIHQYCPDFAAGRNNILALLFDMNLLFEKFILAELKRAARGTGILVKGQSSERFWSSAVGNKNIRPDIMITGEKTIILDTKWKVPSRNLPSDEDLRQMYAYNLQFGADQSYLVYPESRLAHSPVSGWYNQSPHDQNPCCDKSKDKQQKTGCGMEFISIVKDGKLNSTIGSDLLERLALDI